WGKVGFFRLFIPPDKRAFFTKRFLTTHNTAERRTNPQTSLNPKIALEKFPATPAIMFRNLDAHEAELEKIVNEIFFEHAFLIHFLHVRANLLVRELSNVVPEKDFIFGQSGQWGGLGSLQSLRHKRTFVAGVGRRVMVALP